MKMVKTGKWDQSNLETVRSKREVLTRKRRSERVKRSCGLGGPKNREVQTVRISAKGGPKGLERRSSGQGGPKDKDL